MAPFTAYLGFALFIPLGAVVVLSFKDPSGHWTLNNMKLLLQEPYRQGFENSLKLALTTSVVPGILGLVLAHAIATSRFEFFRRLVASASGVLANFGGIPLAFIFIASYSYTGIVTVWLSSLGFNPWDHGFNLSGFNGVVFVYLYFQIPLMVLIITPALGGLRQSWREAAEGLGAGRLRYWRYVGLPVLTPSVLSGMLLLFGSGFAAYATADALTAGTANLAPLMIGNFLGGNEYGPAYANIGYAIGTGMLLVLLVTIAAYLLIRRRASRWLPS
jgi:putative spermidine/putrescine transport system permease protein